MIKTIEITRDGIKGFIDSDYPEMYTLFAVLEELVFIDEIRNEINNDLKAGNKLEYLLPSSSIKVIDNKKCVLTDLFKNDVSTNFPISLLELWRVVEEYQTLKFLDYKKLTINFDGEKVSFEIEK